MRSNLEFKDATHLRCMAPDVVSRLEALADEAPDTKHKIYPNARVHNEPLEWAMTCTGGWGRREYIITQRLPKGTIHIAPAFPDPPAPKRRGLHTHALCQQLMSVPRRL